MFGGKGDAQKEGIDYNEIFSAVMKHILIRVFLSIVAVDNLELKQLDVKITFLHGDRIEEIYGSVRSFPDTMQGKSSLKIINPCTG